MDEGVTHNHTTTYVLLMHKHTVTHSPSYTQLTCTKTHIRPLFVETCFCSPAHVLFRGPLELVIIAALRMLSNVYSLLHFVLDRKCIATK